MALPVVNSSRYTATIPSTNREIQFRPFLVKEEKLLMVALESKDSNLTMRTLKDIINNCVFDELDVNTLTSFDIEWIFLKLRSKSVGEAAEIKLPCEECKVPADISINLDKIEMDRPVNAEDKIVMVSDDVGLELNYPSVDLISKMDYDEEKMTPEEKMNLTLDLIVSSIKTIFDAETVHNSSDSTKTELIAFIDSLNSEQFAKVTAFFGELPALVHNVKFTCGQCGHKNDLELRGLQSFFT